MTQARMELEWALVANMMAQTYNLHRKRGALAARPRDFFPLALRPPRPRPRRPRELSERQFLAALDRLIPPTERARMTNGKREGDRGRP
jgi:hypothetical protein